jgi:hypothetical protein
MKEDLYTFVYRGVLTDASLDKAGRRRKRSFGSGDHERLRASLAFEMLDEALLADARGMAVVYTAIHAFENTVREFVKKIMAEDHGEGWWGEVPEKIRKKVDSRMKEDNKFRYHGVRGGSELMYCDFGDLSSIIVTNWSSFEDVLVDMNWAKAVLSTLEKSRNIAMHGGMLAREDIERIGMNVRDWIRQAG